MKLKKIALCAVAASYLTFGLTFTAAAQDDFSDWNDWGADGASDSEDTSFSADDDFSAFNDDSDSGDDFGGGFSDGGDFGGDFGDDFGGGFGDDFGSFGDDGGSSGGSALTFSGKFSLDTRYYFAKDDSTDFLNRYLTNQDLTTMTLLGHKDSSGDEVGLFDCTLKALPKARVTAAYSGTNSEASLTLNFTEDVLKNHIVDLIDELVLRGYFMDNNLTVEAGKMKVVWGKGDKLHVLDNFNADDYTEFIIPEYIDRRVSTPMLRAVYAFQTANPLTVEGVFTPFLPTDIYAKEGPWMPGSYAKLMGSVYTVASMRGKIPGGTLDDLRSEVQELSDDLNPDTYNLKYAQAGMHVMGTVGQVDWGVSFYTGRYKQPSANVEGAVSAKAAVETQAKAMQAAAEENAALAGQYAALAAHYASKVGTGYPKLDYDRKHTIGVEAATIVGRFNLRGEVAYNLTDDVAGDDPWVHNNSIQWLGGFDFDIPISNININIQETGTFILNASKIDEAHEGIFWQYDVDYVPTGVGNSKMLATNDKLVVNISDSWNHDKIKPEITCMWGIERGDFVLQPKVTFQPTPEFSLALSGMKIWCKDECSEFSYWKNNNFINLSVKYEF